MHQNECALELFFGLTFTLGLSGINGAFVLCSLTSPVPGVEGPDGVDRVFVLHFPGRVTSRPWLGWGGVNTCSQVSLAGRSGLAIPQLALTVRTAWPLEASCVFCSACQGVFPASTVLPPEAHPAGALAGTGGFHLGRGGGATFLPGMLGLRRRFHWWPQRVGMPRAPVGGAGAVHR